MILERPPVGNRAFRGVRRKGANGREKTKQPRGDTRREDKNRIGERRDDWRWTGSVEHRREANVKKFSDERACSYRRGMVFVGNLLISLLTY